MDELLEDAQPTDAQLAAIKDAMDKVTGDGRDADKARQLADQYVRSHPEVVIQVKDWTLERCVQAVETFRAAGMGDNQWQIEAWLLHRFEPQNIGGSMQPTLRVPTLGS